VVTAEERLPLDGICHIQGQDNLDVTAHYAQVSTRFDDEGVSRGASARTAEFLKKRPWSSGESCVHVAFLFTGGANRWAISRLFPFT
jgi:hypothetical protein